jgi:hypothetical protein
VISGDCTSSITKDTTRVCVKRLAVNSASNRTTLVDFLHHLLFACHKPIFIYFVDPVLWRHNASLTWAAISAELHSRAFLAISVTSCLVNRASLIGNFVLLNPPESGKRIAAITSERSILAGNKDLRGKVDVWPSRFSSDLDAIGER